MWELWSQYCDFVCALAGRRSCQERREARRRAVPDAQKHTIDRLKALGVSRFRRRWLSMGTAREEAVGFLGELRFIVDPRGAIRLEGYVDPDKAIGVAKLFR